MTKIYLVRHAETFGNVEHRFHGHFDSQLTQRGYRQLEFLKDRFLKTKLDVIYTSDLTRTKKTAEAIAGERSIPIFKDKALREINGGDLENLSWQEVTAKYSEIFDMFRTSPHLLEFPNGESTVGLQDRIKNKIFEIINKNLQKNICIVSHGMAIKTFLCYALGMELSRMGELELCNNTSVSVFNYSDDKIHILSKNDCSHLDAMVGLGKDF